MQMTPISSTDSQNLQRLRQACRRALERYVDAASHSSGQLIGLNPGGADQLSRANLARLRQIELRAHEAYLEARTALLEFVLTSGQGVENVGLSRLPQHASMA